MTKTRASMSESSPGPSQYNVGGSNAADPRGRRAFPLLLVIILTPIMVGLGFWQLDRARQKRELIDAFEHGGGEAQSLDAALARGLEAALYQRVYLDGHYIGGQQFLLDGQIVGEGQIGYDVLTPFVLDDGRGTLLVDRGFIPQDANRRPLADIAVAGAGRRVQGRIGHLPRAGLRLGPASESTSPEWPRVMLYPERPELEAALGGPLLEPILLLDAGQPDGFEPHWQVTDITPQRHIAYALQWFAFAVTLVVLYLITRKRGRA